jgi:serine/threonine-protein kinase
MKCPKCHTDNPDTSRFCGNCATSLTSAKAVAPSLTKTLQSPTYVVAPGTVIAGHYEVLEKLGQGGMGEVYRALDKNLGRQVAIKILPEEFSTDLERLARFEREAKLLATLNHPNIAAVYGFEEAKGLRFLVLELVEGETLQTRLDRGALHMDEALETCRQVAEGLEAAHDRGVVHRDLKPGNIMITPEGKVKILDFGLAKAFTGEATGIDIANSPTITAQMTEPGVILGTAAYMSPEQARGRSVDKQADIWAFGCILYECLTGERAFYGETVSDTLAHILKGEPDWNKLPAETPTLIKVLLRRCLEKDPRKRLHDIADARIEITEAFSQPSAPEAVAVGKPGRAWILGGIICVLAAGALATFITWHLKAAGPSIPIVRSVLKIGPGQWLDGGRSIFDRPSRTAMAFSSNGSFVVYSAITENPGPQAKSLIYVRRLDQIEAAPVAGTEGGINPFLSPDDRWIGFWEDNRLRKVPISGGVPTTLCEADLPFGMDWGPDNTIVFSPGFAGLLRISGDGGKPEALTVPDEAKGEVSHRLPHFLPDGTGVLFTVMGEDGYDLHPRLALLDLRTRKWRTVMEDAADGRYLRTGHLVFLRQGILMAVAFDLGRLEMKGRPLAVVGDVMQALNLATNRFDTAAGQYSVSAAGWLAYVPGGICPDRQNSLERVGRNGNAKPIAVYKGPFAAPRFSPNGKQIAYRTVGKEWRIWIYDLDRDTNSPVTGDGRAGYVAWTPDGKRLAFDWFKSGPRYIYWEPADGGSPMEQLTTGKNSERQGSFAPDGATMAFTENKPGGDWDILLLDMKSRRVSPLLNSKAAEVFPEISPNGHWLAYVSNESGRLEVWVRPLAGQVGKWQISTEGGSEPLWSKDGKQLFYRQADQAWVVDIQTDAGFSATKPRLLFKKAGYTLGTGNRDWDLWPDGQGFLMVKLDDRKPEPVTEMILVQNWFEELKRLVPASKK